MIKMSKVFVISRNGGDLRNPFDCCCYAAHGEKGGMPDAIGYDTAVHARKFRSAEAAQEYIELVLPEWGRSIHRVTEVRPWDVLLAGLPLFAAMCSTDEPIPDALLEPTKDRLLIWRR